MIGPEPQKHLLNSYENCVNSSTSALERLPEDLFNSSTSSDNFKVSEALGLYGIITTTQATGEILPRCVFLCNMTAWYSIFVTLIGTFPVLSGFTKLLALVYPMC